MISLAAILSSQGHAKLLLRPATMSPGRLSQSILIGIGRHAANSEDGDFLSNLKPEFSEANVRDTAFAIAEDEFVREIVLAEILKGEHPKADNLTGNLRRRFASISADADPKEFLDHLDSYSDIDIRYLRPIISRAVDQLKKTHPEALHHSTSNSAQ